MMQLCDMDTNTPSRYGPPSKQQPKISGTVQPGVRSPTDNNNVTEIGNNPEDILTPRSVELTNEMNIPDHMRTYGLPETEPINMVSQGIGDKVLQRESNEYTYYIDPQSPSMPEADITSDVGLTNPAVNADSVLVQPYSTTSVYEQVVEPPKPEPEQTPQLPQAPHEILAERMKRPPSTMDIVCKDSGKLRKISTQWDTLKGAPRTRAEVETGILSRPVPKFGSLEQKEEYRRNKTMLAIAKLVIAFILGIVFGWMLQKSTVYKPQVIRNQFLFREFIMLKAFLGAMVTGMMCLLIISVVPSGKLYLKNARDAFTCAMTNKGILSTIIGGFILGAGMAVAGACPGMVLAQLGSAVPNSVFTILGGLFACFFYGFIAGKVELLGAPKKPYKSIYLNELLKISYWKIALPLILSISTAVVLMEWFIPENRSIHDQTDNTTQSIEKVEASSENSQFFQEKWLASICGAFIGILQFPIVLLLADTLGSSSGYQTLVSQWVITKKLREKFPYFAQRRSGIGNAWQVLLLLGAITGGALAAFSSGSFGKAAGVPWWQGLIGGFLMLFGARGASGCTSGHGLSGTSLLVTLSFLAVPAMFAGGIAVTFLMEFTGQNIYIETWFPEKYVTL